MAFAERHPELFADAGGRGGPDRHHRGQDATRTASLSPLIPDRLGEMVAPRADHGAGQRPPSWSTRRARRAPTSGSWSPTRSRSARRRRRRRSSSSTRCWPGRRSRCSRSSSRSLGSLDKFAALERVRQRADHDHLRHQGQAHLDRPQPQDGREIAERALVEAPGAGHMVIFESRDLVNAALEQLVTAAAATALRPRPVTETVDRPRPRRRRPRRDPRGRSATGRRSTRRPPRSTRPSSRSRAALAAHGGLLAEHDGAPVGALLFEPEGGCSGCAGSACSPARAGHGVAQQMVAAAERDRRARGLRRPRARGPRGAARRRCGSGRRLGYVEAERDGYRLTMRRLLPIDLVLPDRRGHPGAGASGWPRSCAAGDLVILTGDLGAGKTTLTQGLGDGLGVRGDVTSPTFVIARVHPSLGDGPGARARRRLPARRRRGARRPRPRHRPRRRRHRRRVGRGPGRVAGRPTGSRSRSDRDHPARARSGWRRSRRSAPAGSTPDCRRGCPAGWHSLGPCCSRSTPPPRRSLSPCTTASAWSPRSTPTRAMRHGELLAPAIAAGAPRRRRDPRRT